MYETSVFNQDRNNFSGETVVKIKDVNTDFVWGSFVMIMIALIITIGVMFIVKDHSVVRYYADDGGQQIGCKWIPEENRTVCSTPVCIWAEVQWAGDTKVYCTSDVDKAIEQIKQLNSTLK